MMRLVPFGERAEPKLYYLPEKTDWKYLDMILEPAS